MTNETTETTEETGEQSLTLLNLVDLKLGLDAGQIEAMDDEALAAQIAELLPQKVDAYIHVIDKALAEAEIFDRMAKAAAAAVAARKKTVDRMRNIARLAMTSLGTKKLDGQVPRFGLTLQAGRKSAKVEDVDALPDDLIEMRRVPLTSEITKRLEAGEKIEGATLHEGEPFVTVRRGK